MQNQFHQYLADDDDEPSSSFGGLKGLNSARSNASSKSSLGGLGGLPNLGKLNLTNNTKPQLTGLGGLGGGKPKLPPATSTHPTKPPKEDASLLVKYFNENNAVNREILNTLQTFVRAQNRTNDEHLKLVHGLTEKILESFASLAARPLPQNEDAVKSAILGWDKIVSEHTDSAFIIIPGYVPSAQTTDDIRLLLAGKNITVVGSLKEIAFDQEDEDEIEDEEEEEEDEDTQPAAADF